MTLKIGDGLADGSVIIQDIDRLCYKVEFKAKGSSGIRTISKDLLNEWVAAVEKYPTKTSLEIRSSICGKSQIDKYEYGHNATLQKMAEMVLGKVTTTHFDIPVHAPQGCAVVNEGLYQLITYGAPGTSKSHRTKLETDGHAVYRTTFHPDSDYSTFVGVYKPKMKPEQRINCIDDKAKEVTDKNGKPSMQEVIAYDFVPQAFIKAYVDAWQKMNEAKSSGGAPDSVFLVIEEINRGNCAQIFGDLFQLLDRKEDGYSDYPIDADADLKRFLAGEKQLGGCAEIPQEIREGKKLVLPPNFYIRATMNTSDQSLFPIDSAFKRRWEWKYMPIAKPTEAGWKDRVIVADGKKYDWWDFLTKANAQILETTKSEDKQLGYFFVKAPDATGCIEADRFTGKVLFYLYNDVFKDYSLPAGLFGDGFGGTTKYEFKMFFDERGETIEKVVAAFLDQLKVHSESLSGTTTAEAALAAAE